MATTSEIETGLDAISAIISDQRQVVKKAVANAGLASASLNAITTDYADLIATVQAFGTTNAYEAATKAKFTKLSSEFTALKGVADGIAGTAV